LEFMLLYWCLGFHFGLNFEGRGLPGGVFGGVIGGVLGFFYGGQLVVVGEKVELFLRGFASFVVLVGLSLADGPFPY
ncbi:hypothetical protein RA279_30680, partial [Pseudomonas syringae pv. tagetis]|uniref:hypothetical protein n=1 Tax=Pseudomonas syringae group genomosp. 7 TaxID=251699 RepID=UPI00376FBE17